MNEAKTTLCLGVITDPSTGRLQPCPKQGQDLMDNGYCAEHQPQCIHHLIKELVSLAQALDAHESSEPSSSPSQAAWSNRILHLKQLDQALHVYKQRCESDPSCRMQLEVELRGTLAAFANELKTMGVEVTNEYADVWNWIFEMSQTSIENATFAQQLMLQKDQMAQEKELVQERIDQTNMELANQGAELTEQIMANESEMKQAEQELLKSHEQVNQAVTELKSSEQRSVSCQEASQRVAQQYAALMSQQHRELDELKAKNMQQYQQIQEILSHLDQASVPVNELKQQLEAFKMEYQRRMDELKRTYETQMSKLIEDPSPEGTYFERESKLRGRIDELEEAIENMRIQLEAAQQETAENVERQAMMNVPQSHLGQRMLELAQEVKQKNAEKSALQTRVDNMTVQLAQSEVTCARQMEHMREQDRIDIQRKSDELKQLHSQLADRQADLMNVQNQLHQLQVQSQNKMIAMTNERRQLANRLLQLQTERETWKQNYQSKQDDLKAQTDAMRAELQRQYESKKKELQFTFDQKMRLKESQIRQMQDQMISEKNLLRVATLHQEEQKRHLAQQEAKVERLRQDYEMKMANFVQQKNELRLELERAKEASKLAAEREHSYQQNMNMLQQRNRALQHDMETMVARSQSEMAQLRQQKDRLMSQMNQITANRDALLIKITQSTKENGMLRRQLTDTKSRSNEIINKLTAEVSSSLEKVAAAESNVNQCSAQLQQASNVHAHVKDMTNEVKRLRDEVENRARTMKANEDAIRTLMTDRDLTKSELAKLQASLKEVSAEKHHMQLLHKQSQSEVHQLKQLVRDMEMQIREKTARVQQLLRKEQIAVDQERIRSELKQQQFRQMATEAEIEKELVYKENQKINKRKAQVEKALVDEQLLHARELSMLMQNSDDDAAVSNATNLYAV